ncbi:MAG: DUF302 domain-containing protein [Candidatus Eisenbacteria bacterium]|nr:DUF302 domain-containing protein [Candidatus Eisenbacteria bacterium]
MSDTGYGFGKELDIGFDAARDKVEAALKEEGFGILTEIDVKQTLKEKLDAEFRRYVILGACSPPLAHRAFQAELEIGLLLPCNVILYETGSGKCRVSAVNPEMMMKVVENDKLADLGREARQRLEKALAAL